MGLDHCANFDNGKSKLAWNVIKPGGMPAFSILHPVHYPSMLRLSADDADHYSTRQPRSCPNKPERVAITQPSGWPPGPAMGIRVKKGILSSDVAFLIIPI
jgi:hypothetical protein